MFKNVIKIGFFVSIYMVWSTFAGWPIYNAYESSNYLANKWIINKYNYGSSEYRLGQSILRQEAVWIAALMSWVSNKSICDGLFSDITEDWVCFRAESMREAWLIAKNERFYPKNNVTKNEALAFSVTSNCSNDYNTFRAHNNLLNDSKWDFDDLYDYVNIKNIYDLEVFDGDAAATRGEMFIMSEKAMKVCNDSTSSKIPVWFTALMTWKDTAELRYNEKTIHEWHIGGSHKLDLEISTGNLKELPGDFYMLDLENSTENLKVFIVNHYIGGFLVYDLEKDLQWAFPWKVISRIEMWFSGIYILSYGSNGYSEISLLSNEGALKTLFVWKNDNGSNTSTIKDFELLEGWKVKVIYEYPYQLKNGWTTNWADENKDEEKRVESIIISID
jgi:hypothetical protein